MSYMGQYLDGSLLADIETLTGDAGGAVGPTGGNVNILGGNNITTTGNPGTSTITIDLTGTTDHAVQVGNASGSLTSLGLGLTAQVLKGNTGADPSWGAVDLTTDVTGILPVGSGGTGVGTITAHALIVGDGTSAINEIAVGATDQVLLGNTGADPSWGTVGNAALTNSSVTLNNGNNITVTGSPLSLGGIASFDLTGCTQYAIQVGDATGSLDSLALGTATQMLQSGGAGANPAWSTATWPATTTQGDILYSSADNTVAVLAKDATATRYLANTAASNNPQWDQVNLANGVTGTLPVTNGGTGFATTTAYAVICGGTAATNPLQPIASVGTAAQVLTSNGAGALPTFQDPAPGGIAWSAITANQNIVNEEGYICNKAGLLTLTLPATAAVGTVFEVTGINTDVGWRIAQGAGQQIHFGNQSTTAGAGGYLEATHKRDSIKLVCVVADTEWNVLSSLGNITVV